MQSRIIGREIFSHSCLYDMLNSRPAFLLEGDQGLYDAVRATLPNPIYVIKKSEINEPENVRLLKALELLHAIE